MSTERAWVVGLPAEHSTLGLIDDVHSAASRASKAEPGDRLDIARFESLATRLEQAALNHPDAPRVPVPIPPGGETMLFGQDSKTWSRGLSQDIHDVAISLVAMNLLPVLVIDPYARGTTDATNIGAAEAPAEPWEADDGVFGGRAVEARFRAQIAEALNPDASRRVAISPSGINNAVVTEILRKFVAAAPGTARVDAPVEYRDGSKSAHPFPLRALPLLADLPPASLQLRFALLSIRHTEMDAVVHGAWLRNAQISRPRPAALTDDLVYDISLRQLEELCRTERHVRLHMYQTGLEAAIVGFYRALTTHLLRFPRSVSVQPMYFVAPRKPRKERVPQRGRNGTARSEQPSQGNRRSGRQDNGIQPDRDSSSRAADHQRAPLTDGNTFRKGTVWTT